MLTITLSALLASVLHFQFFLWESVLWGTPRVNKIFKVKPELGNADAIKSFAFNMGFYNLFLSLGTLLSLYSMQVGRAGSELLLTFCCASMVAAGVVLVLGSGGKKAVAGIVQAGPPAVCLFFLHFAG